MNTGYFVKHFPIVAGQLKIGERGWIKSYGIEYWVTRTGNGRFDFNIEEI
jgi:hypothetical protein